MLVINKPESGMRKEVYDGAEDLALLTQILFIDDVPNKEQIDEIVIRILSLVREGSDVVAVVPKEGRAMAGVHATITAGALVFDRAVTYPDEMTVVTTDPSGGGGGE